MLHAENGCNIEMLGVASGRGKIVLSRQLKPEGAIDYFKLFTTVLAYYILIRYFDSNYIGSIKIKSWHYGISIRTVKVQAFSTSHSA